MRKISLDYIPEILQKRKGGVKVMDILKEYGVSDKAYRNSIGKALSLGIITSEDYSSIILKKPKLTPEVVKNIVKDRKNGLFRAEIMKKYGISEATFYQSMVKGIQLGFLKKSEYSDLTNGFSSLSFEGKVKKHGMKKSREICSNAWYAGMGSDLEKLRSAARAGGLKTQEVAPHVLENLVHVTYGNHPRYVYKGIEFRSEGEMWVGIMLVECGHLKKLVEGKNCQVLCGSKVIDYLIDGTAIEYHPKPKGMESHNNYAEDRAEDLKEAGFDGNLIVIEKKHDFLKFGLVPSTLEYFQKRRAANKKVEKAKKLEDELKDVPF